jgi:hypothetical protein
VLAAKDFAGGCWHLRVGPGTGCAGEGKGVARRTPPVAWRAVLGALGLARMLAAQDVAGVERWHMRGGGGAGLWLLGGRGVPHSLPGSLRPSLCLGCQALEHGLPNSLWCPWFPLARRCGGAFNGGPSTRRPWMPRWCRWRSCWARATLRCGGSSGLSCASRCQRCVFSRLLPPPKSQRPHPRLSAALQPQRHTPASPPY